MSDKSKSLKTRILFGGAMILFLAGLFAVDSWIFHGALEKMKNGQILSVFEKYLANGLLLTLVVGILSYLGNREIVQIAQHTGAKPVIMVTLIGAVLITVLPYFRHITSYFDQPALIALLVMILIFAQILRKRTEHAGSDIAWSMFGIIYVGLFLSYLIKIRIHFGPAPIILLIAAVKGSDIGAYFTGILFGKNKLIPWLSPGKTVEGLIGAIVFSVVITLFLNKLMNIFELNRIAEKMHTLTVILFGVCFAVVGHLGDLGESLLKRDAQVKDSARLLPEFGGVLDLIDSILPAGFILYLMLEFIR
jgi:phosphatidate cytidylyltransferase